MLSTPSSTYSIELGSMQSDKRKRTVETGRPFPVASPRARPGR